MKTWESLALHGLALNKLNKIFSMVSLRTNPYSTPQVSTPTVGCQQPGVQSMAGLTRNFWSLCTCLADSWINWFLNGCPGGGRVGKFTLLPWGIWLPLANFNTRMFFEEKRMSNPIAVYAGTKTSVLTNEDAAGVLHQKGNLPKRRKLWVFPEMIKNEWFSLSTSLLFWEKSSGAPGQWK